MRAGELARAEHSVRSASAKLVLDFPDRGETDVRYVVALDDVEAHVPGASRVNGGGATLPDRKLWLHVLVAIHGFPFVLRV
jgi:hypothetical protein